MLWTVKINDYGHKSEWHVPTFKVWDFVRSQIENILNSAEKKIPDEHKYQLEIYPVTFEVIITRG